jgi:hypothetical protein
MKILSPSQASSNIRLQTELTDDFHAYTDGHIWTAVDGDSGALVALDSDGVGGVVTLTTGATDNNEAYLYSPELFKYLDNRPLEFEAAVQYSEANSDDANILVGLMDAPAAGSLLDDGAGPKASYSGAVFFKADGDTVWSVETSIAGTQTTTVTSSPAGTASWQRLAIRVLDISSSTAKVAFFVDGTQCRDTSGNPIVHSVSIGSATEMAVAVGIKAGSANSESLNLDYITCLQKR